jgi:hypothetical protein
MTYQPKARTLPQGALDDMLTDPQNTIISSDVNIGGAWKTALILGAVPFCLLAFGLVAFRFSESVKSTPAQAQPAVVMALPSMSATPAPTSTPTNEPTATIDGTLAANQAAVTGAQATQAQATIAVLEKTQTAEARREAKNNAVGTVTQSAFETQVSAQSTQDVQTRTLIINLESTSVVGNATATEQVKVLTRKAGEFRESALTFGLLLALIIGVPGLAVILYNVNALVVARRKAEQALATASVDFSTPNLSPEPAQSPTREVRLNRQDGYGYGAVDFETMPIDGQVLDLVCEIYNATGKYTQAAMTGDGKPLSKNNGVDDGTFEKFGAWMVANKIAMLIPGGRYAIVHPEFFRQQ